MDTSPPPLTNNTQHLRAPSSKQPADATVAAAAAEEYPKKNLNVATMPMAMSMSMPITTPMSTTPFGNGSMPMSTSTSTVEATMKMNPLHENGNSDHDHPSSHSATLPPPQRDWTSMTRTIAHYERIEQIGEGTYGQVYRARCRDTNQIVALKKIRVHNPLLEGIPKTVLREIKILKRLRHPNLVQMVEVVSSKGVEHLDDDDEVEEKHKVGKNEQFRDAREGYKGNLFLVLEYVSHDLTGLLDITYRFTEIQIKSIFKQLLEALQYMHDNKYVHRDIKSSNILIDHHFRLKLADFGLARCIEPPILDRINDRGNSQEFTNKVITLWYRPPELLLGATRYGTAVDIWSAGCILAELILGKPLFTGKTDLELLEKIFEMLGTPTSESWEGFHDLKLLRTGEVTIGKPRKPKFRDKYQSKIQSPALNLIEKLLELDPNKRLTANRALNSRYFLSDPRAPDNPEELGRLEIEGGHFHEFQTKKKRKEARGIAEKAKLNCLEMGGSDKAAQEEYDSIYRGIMQKVAKEGLNAGISRQKVSKEKETQEQEKAASEGKDRSSRSRSANEKGEASRRERSSREQRREERRRDRSEIEERSLEDRDRERREDRKRGKDRSREKSRRRHSESEGGKGDEEKHRKRRREERGSRHERLEAGEESSKVEIMMQPADKSPPKITELADANISANPISDKDTTVDQVGTKDERAHSPTTAPAKEEGAVDSGEKDRSSRSHRSSHDREHKRSSRDRERRKSRDSDRDRERRRKSDDRERDRDRDIDRKRDRSPRDFGEWRRDGSRERDRGLDRDWEFVRDRRERGGRDWPPSPRESYHYRDDYGPRGGPPGPYGSSSRRGPGPEYRESGPPPYGRGDAGPYGPGSGDFRGPPEWDPQRPGHYDEGRIRDRDRSPRRERGRYH